MTLRWQVRLRLSLVDQHTLAITRQTRLHACAEDGYWF